MNPGESLECCNTSLCNTFQIPTTTLPEPEEPTAMTTTIVTETKAEAASTGGRQESTSGECVSVYVCVRSNVLRAR